MALGLTITAETQATPRQIGGDTRTVTVQGCLERDYLYSPTSAATTIAGTPNMSPTPFKLRQVEIITTEPAPTGAATGTMGAQKEAQKVKGIELHVAAARDASDVDLDGQVNQKVEIVGTMTSKDLMNARGTSTATAGTNAPPLMLKATSVLPLGDKCQ